ncbi:hypothetical protein FB451DRAFT_1164896 [Mycena latifolia]|nr:hypothetical protein FB451DRAFT_1164896 [Mycena latifolia]
MHPNAGGAAGCALRKQPPVSQEEGLRSIYEAGAFPEGSGFESGFEPEPNPVEPNLGSSSSAGTAGFRALAVVLEEERTGEERMTAPLGILEALVIGRARLGGEMGWDEDLRYLMGGLRQWMAQVREIRIRRGQVRAKNHGTSSGQSATSSCFLFSLATISPRRTHSYDFQSPNVSIPQEQSLRLRTYNRDLAVHRDHSGEVPDSPESTHPGLTLPASGVKSDPDNPDFAQHIASEPTATANFNKICSVHFQRYLFFTLKTPLYGRWIIIKWICHPHVAFRGHNTSRKPLRVLLWLVLLG